MTRRPLTPPHGLTWSQINRRPISDMLAEIVTALILAACFLIPIFWSL